MKLPACATPAAVRLAAGQERLRWDRDARYRANLACLITQARRLVLTGLAVLSFAFGWPVSPSMVVRQVLGDNGVAQHPDVCGVSDQVGAGAMPARLLPASRRLDPLFVVHGLPRGTQ